MFSEHDFHWMRYAIELAAAAAEQQEVPVGAVLVANNEMIGEGANASLHLSDPSAHAEIMALREGGQKIKNYRLINTTLYVTLEPCAMCIGALVQARVQRVVFGAFDPKSGAVQSAVKLANSHHFNHVIDFQGGLLAETCGRLLTNFFQERRRLQKRKINSMNYRE